jgi:hypothetical protein
MGKSSSKKKRNRETQAQPPAGSSLAPGQAEGLQSFFSKTALHLLLVAVIGIIAYSNTFRAPFLFDDRAQIQNNQMIKDPANFLLALEGHLFNSSGYRYIPSRLLGYLSFALNYHFGGVDVWGYHVTNLVIHILNGFLVYFLLKLTFKTPMMRRGPPLGEPSGTGVPYSALIALFTALFFVSHPVQTEAVTYIVQRFASLATMFYLLSLVMYIKGRLLQVKAEGKVEQKDSSLEPRSSPAVLPSTLALPLTCFFLSLLFAVCAMKTKEISFTLPLVIVLYESIFFATPLKKRLLFLLPVVLTIVIVPLSFMRSGKPLGEILSDVSAMTRVQTQIPRGDYLVTQMRVITTYIRLMFVPIDQNLDYDYPIYHSLFTPPVLLSFLFLLTLFGAAVWLLYKSRQGARGYGGPPKTDGSSHDSRFTIYRLISFGIFWFFITLSVESSVIPIADVIFEHRLYLPSVGLLTAITAGVFLAAAGLKKGKSIIPVLVVITLALSATTYARNNVWKDETGFWEDVVKKSPRKARPHIDLGVMCGQKGSMDKAREEFQAALRIDPGNAEAHNNLGVVCRLEGRMEEAMREYQAALRTAPDYADAHNNLGVIYRQWGRMDEARTEFQTALRLNPSHGVARRNLEAISQLSRQSLR